MKYAFQILFRLHAIQERQRSCRTIKVCSWMGLHCVLSKFVKNNSYLFSLLSSCSYGQILLFDNLNFLFSKKIQGYDVIFTYLLPNNSALIGWLLAWVVFLHNLPFQRDLFFDPVYEVACFSEKSVRIYQTTQYHNSEDSNVSNFLWGTEFHEITYSSCHWRPTHFRVS